MSLSQARVPASPAMVVILAALADPSCLHATSAAVSSHPSAQIGLNSLLYAIVTNPLFSRNIRAAIDPEGGAVICNQRPQFQNSPKQYTPASSMWLQTALAGCSAHSNSDLSLPIHSALVSSMLPFPIGNVLPLAAASALGYPSCLHTTSASLMSQLSSQTVDHREFELMYTSTRPLLAELP